MILVFGRKLELPKREFPSRAWEPAIPRLDLPLRKPKDPGNHADFHPLGQRRVSYFIDSTPRSLQISFAKTSCISECLGTAERLLRIGLCHQECLPPSLSKRHPRLRRYFSRALLFMRQ
uniref:Uncharacterized protein n=1 Tax=Candidatus Kentrum sp. LPFa TaxID=2126335 RepID=A0A450Y1K1_9GAMM|nr:MAG: hypothetical protein BECKLPF1236C_GA0070990_103723 [Candidatus Kentron sp. LPFa]